MSRRKASRRWIQPLDFLDARKRADLTRKQAADVLDVTVRTIQNWETGGARIPWLAYRMLRILTGCALPGKVWEGWTVHGDRLYAPMAAGLMPTCWNRLSASMQWLAYGVRMQPESAHRSLPWSCPSLRPTLRKNPLNRLEVLDEKRIWF